MLDTRNQSTTCSILFTASRIYSHLLKVIAHVSNAAELPTCKLIFCQSSVSHSKNTSLCDHFISEIFQSMFTLYSILTLYSNAK